MNGSTAFTESLIEGISAGASGVGSVQLLVCPPYPYLSQAASLLQGTSVALGAQTLSAHESGAFTGEVAPGMLTDLGVSHVLVGHSERRTLYGETDADVAAKYAAAKAAGLTPILCVGETLEERESGETEAVIARQLDAVLAEQGVAAFTDAVIAYEPVWAIGTGKTATPTMAGQVHSFIRGVLANHDGDIAARVPILYGGSMKPANAADLLAEEDIDGGLIGGASLKAADFLAIAEAGSD